MLSQSHFTTINFLSSFFVIHVCATKMKKSCVRVGQCPYSKPRGLCTMHCAKIGKLEACNVHVLNIHCYVAMYPINVLMI